MKVRVSMQGATAVVELEENKAGKVFKELAGQLLIYGLGGNETMNEPFNEPEEEVLAEPEPERTEPVPEEEQEEDEVSEKKVPLMLSSQGYKGFLYIKCSKCGEVRAFCSKAPLRYCRCDCGNQEELHDLVPMYAKCECGRTYRYLTNLEEAAFDVNCIACGSPMSVQWNAKKKVYEAIGG